MFMSSVLPLSCKADMSSEGVRSSPVHSGGTDVLLKKIAECKPKENGIFSLQPPLPSVMVTPATPKSARNNNANTTTAAATVTVKQEVHPTPSQLPAKAFPTHINTEEPENPTSKLEVLESGSEVEQDMEGRLSHENALSMFLTLSTSDSDDEPLLSEIQITDVYRDPLDTCMEGLEDLATGILRTGKLSIQGEPGDMTKVQPAMFSLQPMDKELPQLLPQLMQIAFFNQTDQDDNTAWGEGPLSVINDDVLGTGHIRVALPIDTAILHLLNTHCAKGAKQAEELIKTAQLASYIPAHAHVQIPHMPPVIFQSTFPKPPKLVHFQNHKNGYGSYPSDPTTESHSDSSASVQSKQQHTSSSSISTSYSTTEKSEKSNSVDSITSSTSCSSSCLYKLEESTPNEISSNSESTLQGSGGSSVVTSSTPADRELHNHSRVKKIARNKRKESKLMFRPRFVSSGSDFSGDEYLGSERRFIPDKDSWNTTTVDNNTIVAQYGDTSYPLLNWNSKLKVGFNLSSSIGLISGMLTGIDPSKPIVTVKVINPTQQRVAFSIRTYRQSTVFQSHVVYPTKGLHILDQTQCWEDNVEFYPKCSEKNECFIIDLFVCTLDNKPSWNVIRKYAVMKALKSGANNTGRKPRPSQYKMPGLVHTKEENLKLVISHGLQCVVKSKLDEADIILSQALFLPDFQRVTLKAFLYICLAVVANKRKKLGHTNTLTPVLNVLNGATQLLEAYENSPGAIKMPRMLQLVKQLKKELNIHKVMKDQKKKPDKKVRLEEKLDVESVLDPQVGGTITFNSTMVNILPGTLPSTTRLTFSKPDVGQLSTLLRSSGWDKTVQLLTAVHVSCNPETEHFEKPVEINTSLAQSVELHSVSLIRLMQSNYLRHWEDITDDVKCHISVDRDKVQIVTDRTGWLAVTLIQLDPSLIARMAMRSLSIDPIMLQINCYGLMVPDSQSIQLSVFVTPCKSGDDHECNEFQQPQHHLPIAFPHTVQGYPGEKLRIEIQGKFEPDTDMGEGEDLFLEFDVQQSYTKICEKWLKRTGRPSEPLSGKLSVSSCRNSTGRWERITEINISSRTGYASSSPSSSSNAEH